MAVCFTITHGLSLLHQTVACVSMWTVQHQRLGHLCTWIQGHIVGDWREGSHLGLKGNSKTVVYMVQCVCVCVKDGYLVLCSLQHEMVYLPQISTE